MATATAPREKSMTRKDLIEKLNEDLSRQVQWLRETKDQLAQAQGETRGAVFQRTFRLGEKIQRFRAALVAVEIGGY